MVNKAESSRATVAEDPLELVDPAIRQYFKDQLKHEQLTPVQVSILQNP